MPAGGNARLKPSTWARHGCVLPLAVHNGICTLNARTACGQPFTNKTQGVAHPVLPCGVRIYIRFHGKEVLTQVIDRGPAVPGRDFDVTKALANRLGLHGAQTIQWRFAK